jgi:hypothetical protein
MERESLCGLELVLVEEKGKYVQCYFIILYYYGVYMALGNTLYLLLIKYKCVYIEKGGEIRLLLYF